LTSLDASLICRQCGDPFTFTPSAQRFYGQHGLQWSRSLQAIPRDAQGGELIEALGVK
jgi:hypothetical protein